MKKTRRYINHLSIFLILGSYVASPIQVSAQDVPAQELTSEQFLEETQKIESEPYSEGEEENSIDLEETDVLDSSPEMVENVDEEIMFSEELTEKSSNVSDNEDEEAAAHIEVFSEDGYSHVETSPGIVVVTTPSDAIIETLVDYLDEHFQSTAINSLTVQGMTNTGSNDGSSSSFGLVNFTELSYLEMVDLETVGDGALLFLSNLRELYLPKVTTIGSLAFWNNSSLLKLDAPLVEGVGMNALFGVTNLEVLNTPSWDNVDYAAGFGFGPTDSLTEISTGKFDSTFSSETFPNVEKQVLNFSNSTSQSENYIVFSNTQYLEVKGLRNLREASVTGDPSNVEYVSSESIVNVQFSGFVNLENVHLPNVERIFTYGFEGTKVETLNLPKLRSLDAMTSLSGASYLRELYTSNLQGEDSFILPDSLEIIGVTSANLGSFAGLLNNYPSVLFAATESNDSLPLDDKQIARGNSAVLESDLSTYILNEDLSQTSFKLNQNWFFEDYLIGTSDTYAITNMNQSDVGAYHYSVDLLPIGEATYSGSRESRKAQIDIVNEISFTSDFSVNSVIGELKNLEILFTSNVTNINSSFQIVFPYSLRIDDSNIELYFDNASSSLPLGATVTIEDRVVTITNFPLLSGFNYHINIPIMPIAVSEQTEQIKIDFFGNFDPLEILGEVMIASGEFNVSIPDQINFEETSLDFSSIQSAIQKVSPLDIEITSFTAQEESWEIMVSATPFMNIENQEMGEEAIRLVYKENGDMHSLSEEISLAKGSFSGKLDYDFQTDAWSNTSHVLTELEEEGFHVLVGNDYYKLESQQSYFTEVTFTIQYSP